MVLSYICMTLLLITSIFLMIIILLQRGRGGGLAGAFGGLGGQSAFGTKAGDVFTKITIALAVFWIVLAGVSGLALEHDSQRRFKEELPPQGVAKAPEEGSNETAPAETANDKKTSNEAGSATGADKKAEDEPKTPEKPADAKTEPPTDAKDSADDKNQTKEETKPAAPTEKGEKSEKK